MSKYQCGTTGQYARMLTEDAVRAVRGEVRTYNGDGCEEWVKDPDIDPAEEVLACCCELAHHLFQSLASANAIEQVSGFKADKPGEMLKYAAAHAEYEQKWADDWSWLYEDEEE